MAMNEREKTEIVFEIVESIGVISTSKSGWNKELNLVSWNGKPVKYDMRDWDENHEHMGRGITLHPDEMIRLIDLMKKRKI